MATPGSYSMQIYRGDSYRWQFALWLDAGHTQPIDLTGITPRAQIRDKPIGKKITQLNCIIVNPNIVEVTLPAAASQELSITKGVWDLQLTYPSGDVSTVVAGSVDVTFDVTE